MARRQLEAVNAEVFMLAEAEEPDHHNRAFDMSYGWHFHHLTNQVAQGKEPVQVLRDYLEEEAERFPSDAYRLGFITNHDENSWNGTVEERYGEAGDAMAVLAATLLDMPLVYSGQESSNRDRLRFFEKDTVEWGDYNKSDFYRQLNGLNHTREALWNGDYGGAPHVLATSADDHVFAFAKEKNESTVVVILNLSADPQEVSLTLPDAALNVVMGEGNAEGWGEGQTLGPWSYCVLATEG